MNEENKRPTRDEYYLNRHHQIINSLYEEAHDLAAGYKYDAATILEAMSNRDSDDDKQAYIDKAASYASMASGVEAFKSECIYGLWKHGYIGMEYDAYEESGREIHMRDTDCVPPSDWVMIRFYVRRIVKRLFSRKKTNA